jgi:2-polyprenyl-3-methyl-5-hydroxy-6-metoxy-1,4-benzoquinol methylase
MEVYKEYQYYNENADHSHAYLKSNLIKLLGYDSKKILDLGCGNGSLTKCLIEKGFDAYGTDASASGINIAKQTYPERFEIQDLSSQELPEKLNDKIFDTIIAIEVIEHLYNPREFVSSCKKILKRSSAGKLILSTPYHGYIKNVIISLMGKWESHANPLWDGGHIKLWSKKTLTKLLTEQGFKVVDSVGCGRVPYLWKSIMIMAVL